MAVMNRTAWVAVIGSAALVLALLLWYQRTLNEEDRKGKLWAKCQQSYSPECDELEKDR